ncbi:MAG: metal ABC transporter permease [Polyangiaceae bacterium]|nr:metal ABC transporter permease [Polyangiaceae bacterium]
MCEYDWISFFCSPIVMRAMLVGVVLAALLGALGVLVVARGLSNIGDGLSHAAFGGIALALFLGASMPLVVAIPFTSALAMTIGVLRRKGGLRSDVAMATLFSCAFAVGTILIKKATRTQSSFDPEQLLFGSILFVNDTDVVTVLALAAVTIVFILGLWSRIAYATFDEELARLSGIEVGWLESALLALLAAVIVASIRLAGVVLVSAFLVIPAATSRHFGKTLSSVVLYSIATGVFGAILGFVLARGFAWPVGASIVLALGAQFVVTTLFDHFRRRHPAS